MGRSPVEGRALLLAQIEGAIEGGVDVVQVREPHLEAGDYTRLVRDCVARTRGRRARIVVNDRLDVAKAAGAHGLHLREDGLPLEAARRLAPPPFLIGCSIHTAAAAARTRAADYLVAGSVFATASKPGLPSSLGLVGLEAVVRAAAPCPVWAVGGIGPRTIAAVRQAGAQGAAAIGAFIPVDPTEPLASAVQKLTADLRFLFDSSAEPA
jgi:thiamine-phosphate pyrophosphorylase